MLNIAWTELLVIAIIALLVVGPRELPRMLRTIGSFTGQMRRMAGDFQRQFNEALREAELDEVKRGIDAVRSTNPATAIRNRINPLKPASRESGKGAVADPVAPEPAEGGDGTGSAQSVSAASPAAKPVAKARRTPRRAATPPAGEAGATEEAPAQGVREQKATPKAVRSAAAPKRTPAKGAPAKGEARPRPRAPAKGSSAKAPVRGTRAQKLTES